MAPASPREDAERLTTLLHLVRLGAVRSFVSIPTRALGDSMDLSQQAASLRLKGLEGAGLIERARSGRGLAVRLTDLGLSLVEAFLADANASLERGKNELTFRGTLFTGLGEGGYYVSLKGYASNFSRAIGFEPYPGTLNLRLASEAMVAGKRQGGVLAIERTHYDSSVLEVISPVNLRKSLGLKDGDECSVTAFLGERWARRR